jgi:hypothetical protein
MGTITLPSENLTNQQDFLNEMVFHNFKSSSTHSYHCLVEVGEFFFFNPVDLFTKLFVRDLYFELVSASNV